MPGRECEPDSGFISGNDVGSGKRHFREDEMVKIENFKLHFIFASSFTGLFIKNFLSCGGLDSANVRCNSEERTRRSQMLEGQFSIFEKKSQKFARFFFSIGTSLPPILNEQNN